MGIAIYHYIIKNKLLLWKKKILETKDCESQKAKRKGKKKKLKSPFAQNTFNVLGNFVMKAKWMRNVE